MWRTLVGGCAAHVPSGPLSAAESAAVQRLYESRRELVMEGHATDVKSEVGYGACAGFLTNIEQAAHALTSEVAPREYRKDFTANYRALFPDDNRHYRVDVLEASVEQQFDIWVNGEKFELSDKAIDLAQALQRSWCQLIRILDRWPYGEQRPTRQELDHVLAAFDRDWAGFESIYIRELIDIEEKARKLVVCAIESEQKLPRMDKQCLAGDETAEENFLRYVARLNAIANYKRKGRDDLGADILKSARGVLRQLEKEGPREDREAARVLAGDVIASYKAMRKYMQDLNRRSIEHLDPHLCNNTGLVARLVDYEETWEIGARYVADMPMLDAICDVVAQIRAAESVAPALSAMIEDCDVELFMVLPRLTVLSFLANPAAPRAALVRGLLPHRLAAKPGSGVGDATDAEADQDLRNLRARFHEAVGLLNRGGGPAPRGDADAKAEVTGSIGWKELVRQAVLGDRAPAGVSEEARLAARGLLRAAETWSLELQRHCPEDWNQCCAVLVHCLTGGHPDKPPPTKSFVV